MAFDQLRQILRWRQAVLLLLLLLSLGSIRLEVRYWWLCQARLDFGGNPSVPGLYFGAFFGILARTHSIFFSGSPFDRTNDHILIFLFVAVSWNLRGQLLFQVRGQEVAVSYADFRLVGPVVRHYHLVPLVARSLRRDPRTLLLHTCVVGLGEGGPGLITLWLLLLQDLKFWL